MNEIKTPESSIESAEQKSLSPAEKSSEMMVDKIETIKNTPENVGEIDVDAETPEPGEKAIEDQAKAPESDYRINNMSEAWNQAILEDVQRDATNDGITPAERTSGEKGNFGEMATDVEMAKEGWIRISKDNFGVDESDSIQSYREKVKEHKVDSDTVTSLSDRGHQGIDGVYQRTDNNTGETEYCIVESKYGTSRLGNTADGKQMGLDWLGISEEGGSQRLEDAVGVDKAKEIREAHRDEKVEFREARVDRCRTGEAYVEFKKLDPYE